MLNELLFANLNGLASEKNGYSTLRDGRVDYFLDYGAYLYQNILYSGEKTYILHMRTSTGGGRGVDGLHLQNINGWRFAHNGYVTDYAGGRDKNDSYYFCKRLITKPITKARVENEIDIRGFTGKGFLYRKTTKDLYIFNNSTLYVYGIKDCLIFSTFVLTTDIKKIKEVNILGFKDIQEEETGREIKFLINGYMEDTFLHLKNGQVIQREKIVQKTWWEKNQDKKGKKGKKGKKNKWNGKGNGGQQSTPQGTPPSQNGYPANNYPASNYN